MKKINLVSVKSRAKQCAPIFLAGVAVGVSATAVIGYRYYNPKDMIAIQMPPHLLRTMKESGKGLAINSNVGWFTLKYVPND